MQNCPHFGIKIPLVNTTEANGSFEVVPGSQYLNEFPAEAGMSWDDVLNAEGRAVDAAFGQTRRLNLKKGSMWVQDPRALHRGTRVGHRARSSVHALTPMRPCAPQSSIPGATDRRG